MKSQLQSNNMLFSLYQIQYHWVPISLPTCHKYLLLDCIIVHTSGLEFDSLCTKNSVALVNQNFTFFVIVIVM